MHGYKLLLDKPHVAQGTNFMNLKSHKNRNRITIINFQVFQSANIAVLGLILHPPCHNLE